MNIKLIKNILQTTNEVLSQIITTIYQFVFLIVFGCLLQLTSSSDGNHTIVSSRQFYFQLDIMVELVIIILDQLNSSILFDFYNNQSNIQNIPLLIDILVSVIFLLNTEYHSLMRFFHFQVIMPFTRSTFIRTV